MSEDKEPRLDDDNYYEYWIRNTKRWIKEIEDKPLGTSDNDYIHIQRLKAQLKELIEEEKINNKCK